MFHASPVAQQWMFWVGIAIFVYTFYDYHRSIVSGQTKPYILAWLSLGTLTTISAFLQLTDGAALGGCLTLAAGVNNFFVAIQSKRYGGKLFVNNNGDPCSSWKEFVRVNWRDVSCLVVAALSTVVWLAADNATLAVIGLSIASLAAIAMTFIKSWRDPHSEPVRKYVLSTVRYVMAAGAVAHYTFVTGFYPTLWIGVNASMAAFLIVRRRYICVQTSERIPVVHADSVLGIHPIDMLPCCGASYFSLPAEDSVANSRQWRSVTCRGFGDLAEEIHERVRRGLVMAS